MSIPLQAWYAIGGILSFLTVILLFFARVSVQFRQAFKNAASTLGLTWEPTGFLAPGECSGTIDGDAVSIRVDKRGSGSFERQLTIVEVDMVPPLSTEFTLGHENLFTRAFRRAGVADIEFDDKKFDKLFRVSGPDPVAVRRLMSAEAREALLEMARGSDDLSVRPERIRWEFSGRVTSPKTLVRVATAAVAAARILRNNS